jgi:transcriptional regulator with PAS, ATPase and Fis domain
VVSATNKNLDAMMEKTQFRRDLYFRLGVIKVQIPSLNERREDIIPLAKFFLNQFNDKFNRNISGLSSECRQTLLAHNWTGNVRELKNLIERGVLIGKGSELSSHDLGMAQAENCRESSEPGRLLSFPPIPKKGVDLKAIEAAMERHYIEAAYQMANGNESRAAQLLRMNHHTYRYRRRKLDVG